MGIAWLDAETPPEEARALRTFGRPLLPVGAEWPACPRCDLPLLFRAQVPLVSTSLVSYDDSRILSIFECHRHGGQCEGGQALILEGKLVPHSPPAPISFDVLVPSTIHRDSGVARVLSALGGRSQGNTGVVSRVPPSIANEAVRAINRVGGKADLRTSSRTVLAEARGGRIAPFEDCFVGTRPTTLRPLDELVRDHCVGGLRGILGGDAPGHRNESVVSTLR